MHPAWCDLGDECVNTAHTFREHDGRVLAFYDERGEVRVEMRLGHPEDIDSVTGRDEGRTYVALRLTATEWTGSEECQLYPHEARHLAKMLMRYAVHAERDCSWGTEEHLREERSTGTH